MSDVLLDPDNAPREFWQALLAASDKHLLNSHPTMTTYFNQWSTWMDEVRFGIGWSRVEWPQRAYASVVLYGGFPLSPSRLEEVPTSSRLAAVEHLIDLRPGGREAFVDAVNQRARHFRVGLAIVGSRFVSTTSEHLHTEIVQPTLVLLADRRYTTVDDLYRKAFERVLSGDHSGAVTAASSAVEEMLRLRTGISGLRLKPLAEKARSQGVIIPTVRQFITNLDALRQESDAHAPGTDDFGIAMLAVHLTGSILLHLAEGARLP